jgi:hypothetical protein
MCGALGPASECSTQPTRSSPTFRIGGRRTSGARHRRLRDEPDHPPASTFESALYGAAGVAHHAGLTRLLPDRALRRTWAAGWPTTRPKGSDVRRGGERTAARQRADHDAPPQARLDAPGRRPLAAGSQGVVATLAGAGNIAAIALALDLGFALSAEALSLAVCASALTPCACCFTGRRGAAVRSGAGPARAERGFGLDAAWIVGDPRHPQVGCRLATGGPAAEG